MFSLVATLLMLGLVEGVARAVLPPPGPVHVLKPGMRWAQPPNQLEMPWGVVGTEEQFFVTTDGDGLRLAAIGRPYRIDDDNTTTIAFLGDSIIFGWGVSGLYSVPMQLEVVLRHLDPKGHYRVINAGSPGYSATQSYLLFKNVVLNYQPDIVVFQIAEHNFSPREVPDSEALSLNATSRSNLWLLKHSRLYRSLHKPLANRMAAQLIDDQPAQNADHRGQTSLSELIARKPDDDSSRAQGDRGEMSTETRVPPDELREVLVAMSEMGEQNGFKLATYFQADSQLAGDLAPWFSAVESLDSTGQITHLSMYDELQLAGTATELFLLYGQGTSFRRTIHYNPIGSRIVAGIIAGALAQRGLLPPAP